MKKSIASSLLAAELSAFVMFLLLFFLLTGKPLLLLVPIAGVICIYFAVYALLSKRR